MGVTLSIACKQGDPTGRPASRLSAGGCFGGCGFSERLKGLTSLKGQRINITANPEGLTSLKSRGTPTAKDLRAERKIEWMERMEGIDAIEDRYNRWDGVDWWIWGEKWGSGEKSGEKIWSCRKKVVTLHSQLRD